MPTDPHIPRATGWRLHTPNALVLVRIAIAALVFAILAGWSETPREPSAGAADSTAHTPLLVAAALFVIAALTDAADGALARKWNAITTFGRVMDPFADKILVLGALVLLAGPGFARDGTPLAGFTGWMVVVIIARELLVTSLRGLAEGSGIDASANWSGKAKMVLQSIAVPAVLISLALLPEHRARPVNASLAWATTAVTALSALPYLRCAAATESTTR